MEDQEGERGVYIISVAAELVGVHPQTLRIYERKGLLTPSRTAGNTRRYSERDIDRLQTIQRLTQEGVNLAGVKMIVEMENELDRLRERMQLMREQMRQAEERVRREVDRVRREFRAEIVPLSDMRSAERRLKATLDRVPHYIPRRIQRKPCNVHEITGTGFFARIPQGADQVVANHAHQHPGTKKRDALC